MLAVHCKKTESVDLKTPLLAYIKSVYSERDATEAADDLDSVQKLRTEVAAVSSGAPAMREALSKWVHGDTGRLTQVRAGFAAAAPPLVLPMSHPRTGSSTLTNSAMCYEVGRRLVRAAPHRARQCAQ